MQAVTEECSLAAINFTNNVAVNFFTRTKRWIQLQLSNTQRPQLPAVGYFSALPSRHLQAWCSIILRAGTNPQYSVVSLLPTYHCPTAIQNVCIWHTCALACLCCQ